MWRRWCRKWYCNVIDNDYYEVIDDDDDGWQWLGLRLTGGCVVNELKRVVYRVEYNYQMGELVLKLFPNWRTLYT